MTINNYCSLYVFNFILDLNLQQDSDEEAS